MNLGLTTSFIIAGMLMLIIGTFNMRLGQHATDLTLHEISKSHIESVYEMILYDFKKIGYDIENAIQDPILTAEGQQITFEAKLDQDSATNPSTVTWVLTDNTPAASNNPNHRVLERTVDGDTTPIGIGITRFDLRYFNENGDETSNLTSIRYIEVIIETQPREGIAMSDGQTRYPVTQWRKTIVPGNLSIELE